MAPKTSEPEGLKLDDAADDAPDATADVAVDEKPLAKADELDNGELLKALKGLHSRMAKLERKLNETPLQKTATTAEKVWSWLTSEF